MDKKKRERKKEIYKLEKQRLEGMYSGRMEERVSIKSEDSVVALPLSSNIVQPYVKIES